MAGVIDSAQPLPVYVQLKTLLLEDILAGAYDEGRLPTEHELSALYSISRTPVHRALAELADEGVILRQRRNGTFVNPHWLTRHRGRIEVRVVVPEGPWQSMLTGVCPAGISLNVATVSLNDLHQVLGHAVAEGRAPDLALFDSVWVHEFASAGFLQPLDEVDPDWLRAEYLADAVDPFRSANQWQGQVIAIQAEADVAGLWYDRQALAAVGAAPPGPGMSCATWGAGCGTRGTAPPWCSLRGRGAGRPRRTA